MGSCYGKPETERRRSKADEREEGEGGGKKSYMGGADTVDGVPGPLPEAPEQANTVPINNADIMSPRREVNLDIDRLIPIRYSPADEWSQCAYCGNPAGDRYDYFCCSDMPSDLLEDLMDHGWWRTGHIIFKPRFQEVCCPGYAMRVRAATFVPSKSHRRIIRRWKTFLMNGDPRWEERGETWSQESVANNSRVPDVKELVQAVVAGSGEGRDEPRTEEHSVRPRKVVTPGKGADPNKPPCKKAKQLRAERQQRKHAANDRKSPIKHTAQPKKTLCELLRDHKPNANADCKHTLEVKLLSCNPRDPQLNQTLFQAYRIYDKFQRVVHPGKVRFNSPFEFQLGFFNSPIKSPPDQTLGSYHMHYYLDGELLMISILDILPTYIVSIYFIYDPDIRFMTPGIYTCLCELELIQDLQKQQPTLVYYALGYYNHFNPKVSYKRQFGAQELLCNETDTFVSLAAAIPKFLISTPYVRLADDDIPEKEGRTASIDNMVVVSNVGPRPFGALSPDEKNVYRKPLKNFVAEAGTSASHKFLFYIG